MPDTAHAGATGISIALLVLAGLLAWPAPRIMAGLTTFRAAPRAALVVWQAAAAAAVMAALFAAPAAVALYAGPRAAESGANRTWLLVAALVVSGVMLARLLWCGHRVGRNLRTVRRDHRDLVDLLAERTDRHTRVLEHPTPTAYCLPGWRRRVVLTQGALAELPDTELDAVLAHERAHLDARHDLVLEFFTVMHEAVPGFVRSDAALTEVKLLIEVLADRAAVRSAGPLPTGRAIVRLAGRATPTGALGAGGGSDAAAVRVGLLDDRHVAGVDARLAAALMYVTAAVLVVTPPALLLLAWS